VRRCNHPFRTASPKPPAYTFPLCPSAVGLASIYTYSCSLMPHCTAHTAGNTPHTACTPATLAPSPPPAPPTSPHHYTAFSTRLLPAADIVIRLARRFVTRPPNMASATSRECHHHHHACAVAPELRSTMNAAFYDGRTNDTLPRRLRTTPRALRYRAPLRLFAVVGRRFALRHYRTHCPTASLCCTHTHTHALPFDMPYP